MYIICIQFDLVWENPPANHALADALVASAEPRPGDLVLLPEMFATGFTMDASAAAEQPGGPTRQYLSRLAERHEAYVLGGLATARGSGARNEAVLVGPGGQELARYAKMHTFSLAGEGDHYDAGREVVVGRAGDVTVAPAICYDLRFPGLFRAAARRGAEVLAVIANWPADRAGHWRTLLRARAIENQAYVAGVNRCGRDPNTSYAGGSLIVDPRGRALAEAGDEQGAIRAEVDVDALRTWRREFPALRDMRDDLA